VTKSELVDQVADRADLTKHDAGRAVDAVLRRGSEVTVSGFGKFHVGERGARQGVNPRTGERIQIAASRVPRFTAGSGLKSAVKGR
jgi:DNA-binding protein HU-beta